MLLTSNLKFLSSTYLSIKSQWNVGCLTVSLSVLDPMLISSLLAQSCLTSHSNSHHLYCCFNSLYCCLYNDLCNSCLISHHMFYLFTIFLETAPFECAYLLGFLCLPIWDFYFWHHVMLLVVMKITLIYACIHSYYLYLCYHYILIYYMHVFYKYTMVMPSDAIYARYQLVTWVLPMIGSLCTLFTQCCMLVHTYVYIYIYI